MPKDKEIRQEKKKGLTDKELIEKYGNDVPDQPFEGIIKVMLSKPNPNATAKVAKR